MKLVNSIDFDILEELADGRRNVAVNIAKEIGYNRSYVNTRLPILQDYGLLKRIGPAPNSGLYEITEKGIVVHEHCDAYNDPTVDFEELIEEELEG